MANAAVFGVREADKMSHEGWKSPTPLCSQSRPLREQSVLTKPDASTGLSESKLFEVTEGKIII